MEGFPMMSFALRSGSDETLPALSRRKWLQIAVEPPSLAEGRHADLAPTTSPTPLINKGTRWFFCGLQWRSGCDSEGTASRRIGARRLTFALRGKLALVQRRLSDKGCYSFMMRATAGAFTGGGT
jgi:hypothetical protein